MSPPDEVVEEAVRLTRLARRVDEEDAARDYRERRDRLLDRHGYAARVRTEGGALGGAGRSRPSPESADQPADRPADRARTADRNLGRRAVLVCYPTEWVVEGTVDPDRIEDTSRAVERRITGPGEGAEWEAIEAHNRAVAEQVAADHGPVHGANARAFADFMGNHYARRVESATAAEVAEFLEEYFPRNAWPTDDQRAVVERSVELVRERARRREGDG